jgi:hypothetical protein
MRASASFTWAAFLCLAALSANACAPMVVGPPVVTDMPRGIEARLNGTGATDNAVAQEGSRVAVRVTELCDVQSVTMVERTTIHEYQNDAPHKDWWAGIGGGVLAGVGVTSVVNPKGVRSNDPDLTDADVRQSGYLLIGLGAALLTVPVIDAIRANSVAERKVEEVEAPGPTLRRNVACGKPQVAKAITLSYPDGRQVEVGPTNPQGRLTVDLAEQTPRDLFFARDGIATIYADEREIGRASLTTLYDERAATAWHLVESSACNTSLDDASCSAADFYVTHYAGSDHTTDGRKLLADASTRRLRAREEAAWGQLNLQACRSPAKRDLETIEAACAPLATHLAEFPEGPHVEELSAAMRPSEAISARLKAAEERRVAVSIGA